jgi:hypothetical protein
MFPQDPGQVHEGDAVTLIIDAPEDVRALTRSALLGRVLRVEFNVTSGDTVAKTFELLPDVQSVTFIDDENALATVKAIDSHLPNTVRALTFAGFMATTFDNDAAAILCRSPRVAPLEHLALYNCNLTRQGAKAIGSGTFHNLTALHLGLGNYTMNHIGPDGVQHLTPLTRLTTLDLDYNHIGDKGVRALRAFPGLEQLHLQANDITNRGLLALCDAPFLRELGFLDLRGNRISPRGIRHLRGLTLPKLHAGVLSWDF